MTTRIAHAVAVALAAATCLPSFDSAEAQAQTQPQAQRPRTAAVPPAALAGEWIFEMDGDGLIGRFGDGLPFLVLDPDAKLFAETDAFITMHDFGRSGLLS